MLHGPRNISEPFARQPTLVPANTLLNVTLTSFNWILKTQFPCKKTTTQKLVSENSQFLLTTNEGCIHCIQQTHQASDLGRGNHELNKLWSLSQGVQTLMKEGGKRGQLHLK